MNKELSHAEKIRQTGINKYGSEKAWREAQAANGKQGGVKSNPNKGYGSRRDLAGWRGKTK